MKFLSALIIMAMTSSIVLADNFYQNTNPFPNASCEPKLNNIYETEPAVMNKEQEVAKKANAKWWNRLRSEQPVEVQTSETQANETPAYIKINEGVIKDNNSFVVFPSK